MCRNGFLLAVVFVLSLSIPASGEVSPFTEEALERGLNYPMAPYPQPQGFDGQGSGFADLDADGDPDAIVIGSISRRIGIFENIGGGIFVDRTLDNGIPPMVEHEGFAAADYDADGRIDLYITRNEVPDLLFRNLGNFQFEDVTVAAGLGADAPNTGASWGDYDGDGWLDLYVCSYSGFAEGDPPNVLYRNRGDGTFEEVGEQLGVDSVALSFQSVWTDYDRDGDKDLYVSNDRGVIGWPPNQLWRNDGGTFTDVSDSSGAGVALFSMGLAAGDFDGNTYPDFYVTDLTGTECPQPTSERPIPTTCSESTEADPYEGWNPLLLNQGDGTFIDQAGPAGVNTYKSGWGAIFFDFDNNGYKDLYVNNMWSPNSMFTNTGEFPCDEIAEAAGVQASYDPDWDPDGIPPATIVSYSSAVADVDADGAIDLLVNNVGYRAELFINNEGPKGNFVRYEVVGEFPNLFAVGAIVETTAGGREYFDESYAGGNGYLGQNELVLHVGLGAVEQVEQAVVRWPSGGPVRTLSDLPVNETWRIYPPSRLCDVEGDGIDHDDFLSFALCHDAGFVPGCEMMDFDGDSGIDGYDLMDCYAEDSADCNLNGTIDLLEILFDPGIDLDQDGTIDCCGLDASTPPHPIGSTLLLERSGLAEAILTWEAPASDPDHGPATSYDVLRSVGTPHDGFVLVAQVPDPYHADAETTAPLAFYRVVARNDCGSSGEEPF